MSVTSLAYILEYSVVLVLSIIYKTMDIQYLYNWDTIFFDPHKVRI